ncbi:MAG TPA: hypothetical protein VND91_00410 [Candidatus Saccharimonadia bacterium]|nr:hypothetical protein [Candidatus Saccharimonadia bacterium]
MRRFRVIAGLASGASSRHGPQPVRGDNDNALDVHQRDTSNGSSDSTRT